MFSSCFAPTLSAFDRLLHVLQAVEYMCTLSNDGLVRLGCMAELLTLHNVQPRHVSDGGPT